MIFRYEYPGGVWVDLERPTEDEIQNIAREFSISERMEAELYSPTPSPLVAGDEGSTLLVLHFPEHSAEGNKDKNQEIDFVVGSHFILTVRYEVVVPLHHLKKLLETQKVVANHHNTIVTDVLLEILFAHLYAAVRDHTNHVADNLAHVEREMFDGHERDTVRLISDVSREFLHLEAALANQEESFGRFLKVLTQRDFFGASFAERAERIFAEHTQVARLIKTHRAISSELRETNIALLEVRQNEIMKTLTIITFSVMPLELIALVFGMHMLGAPLEQDPNAFWIIIALMIGTGACMVLFFTRKRWL